MEALDAALLYRLRSMTAGELSALCDVSEGLENRLARLCQTAVSREELLEALKCKRYTRARLSRILTCALLGLTQAFTQAHPVPPYARVIGFRRGARDLLAVLKERSAIPLVTDTARIAADPVFALEKRATDLRALCTRQPAGRDRTQPMLIVDT